MASPVPHAVPPRAGAHRLGSGGWVLHARAPLGALLSLGLVAAACTPPGSDPALESGVAAAAAAASVHGSKHSLAAQAGLANGAPSDSSEPANPLAKAAAVSLATTSADVDEGAAHVGGVPVRLHQSTVSTSNLGSGAMDIDSSVDLALLLAAMQHSRVRRPVKRKAPPLGLLEGSYARIRTFDAEFSPRPWQTSKWDPGGFIDYVDGERVFRTVSPEREVVPQRRGHRDLGCLSGMMEAVRRTVHPQLALLDVEPCHAGPNSSFCTPERTGVRVLEQLAVHLEPKAKLQPLQTQPIGNDTPLAVIPELPWMGLCSLGHDARKRDRLHYEHHMVIASRVQGDEIIFFDVTGNNGPNLRRIYEDRLRYYLAEWLARSKTFDYDPSSASLTCLAVLPPEN